MIYVRWKSTKLTHFIAPLYNQDGKVVFFLGGQINCSTTIRSCSDVLRILSMAEDGEEEKIEDLAPPTMQGSKPKSSFFRSFRKQDSGNKVEVREAGMEPALLDQIAKQDFKTQMRMFYSAYSKVCCSVMIVWS